MATVTYKKQPAIWKTSGSIPESGTEHPYTVSALLWPESVEGWIAKKIIGLSIHVCCGESSLGDVRVDIDPDHSPTIISDAQTLPILTRSFDTAICDPPYNGKFQWNHDLLSELVRVARRRIIFQHWFVPVNQRGKFRKAKAFRLSELALWQGQTYFGRAQIISVFDRAPLPLLSP